MVCTYVHPSLHTFRYGSIQTGSQSTRRLWLWLGGQAESPAAALEYPPPPQRLQKGDDRDNSISFFFPLPCPAGRWVRGQLEKGRRTVIPGHWEGIARATTSGRPRTTEKHYPPAEYHFRVPWDARFSSAAARDIQLLGVVCTIHFGTERAVADDPRCQTAQQVIYRGLRDCMILLDPGQISSLATGLYGIYPCHARSPKSLK